jgi:hypothetical protein
MSVPPAVIADHLRRTAGPVHVPSVHRHVIMGM